MFDKLNLLKLNGYYPDTILDIGAYHGNWTRSMKQVYGNASYLLFEAIDYDELKVFPSVYNVVLNDKVEEVNWYQMKNTGDSIFREKTHFFTDDTEDHDIRNQITVKALDKVCHMYLHNEENRKKFK